MSPACYRLVAAILCAGLTALPTRADEMKAELDTAANVRLLDTHFARYGYAQAKSITREGKGIRIQLPAATKEVGQTGMYSYVVLAGDFELSANYEWIAVTPPNGGYGVSCGIAVDTGVPGIMVSLARANLLGKGKGNGYAVTVGKTAEIGTTKYETTHFRTEAKKGRLVLRREQAELACLVAEGAKDSLRELCRLEFTEVTVGQVRIYADAGGSPTAMDVRLGPIRIRAEEIVGGFAKRDQPTNWPWWPFAAGFFFVATVVLVLVRRRQKRQQGE